MFSIIVPLYNKEHFVYSTLQSVINQSYKNFEVIIVDDSSTDNSLQVARQIKDPRIKIYTKPNGGVSLARNFGIEKAQYDYIVFLDADDLWESDFLSSIYNLIQAYPTAGMFCTGFNKIINGVSRYISIYPNDGLSRLITNYCEVVMQFGYTPCWTSAICVKRDVIRNVGDFQQGITSGEDLDMWLRVGLKYPIAYLSSPKAIYQSNTENNYNSKPIPYEKTFPYDKWYSYASDNKWLACYATHMNVLFAQSLNREHRYKESIMALRRCKGKCFLFKRCAYYFLSYFNISL